MALREIEYLSFNERDMVKSWVYIPISEPKAVVQIVHGLGEHSRRYLHMIVKMLDHGFIVCADDHVGHGKTAHDSNTWGNVGAKGYMTTIEDENTLRTIVQNYYPELPYFMYGHSWGSTIARNYAAHYGKTLKGLILSGAPADNTSMLSLVDKARPYIDAGRDDEVISGISGGTYEQMKSRYKMAKTPTDWIATSEDVVKDPASDPFNNFHRPANIRLLYDLGYGLKMVQGVEWASKLPLNMPILNISGDMDPCVNFGEGTYRITKWLNEAGNKNVITHVYSGYRHEIHNEPDIRDHVEQEILDFIHGNL